MLRRLALLLLLAVAAPVWAQGRRDEATWSGRIHPADARAGESAQLVLNARIKADWYLYSMNPANGDGPYPTRFEILMPGMVEAQGKAVEPAPHTKFDKGFGKEVRYFEKEVAFAIPVRLLPTAEGQGTTTVRVTWMACTEGRCTPPTRTEVVVNYNVAPGEARTDRQTPLTSPAPQPAGYEAPGQTPAPAAIVGAPDEMPPPAPVDSGPPPPERAPDGAPPAPDAPRQELTPPSPDGAEEPRRGSEPQSAPEASSGPQAAGAMGSSQGPPPASGSSQVERFSGVDQSDIKRRISEAQRGGILPFLGLSIVMGFLALLTPCVFPMVPITVSFFAKQQEQGRNRGIRGALVYCLGIVGTLTGLGVLVSVIFTPTTITDFATHPLVNLALAVLFIALAFNLFGAYEIVLPGWLVQKTQSASGRGGLAGPLFMGLTFTLTSFTCTVGFVGALLGTLAQSKNILLPTLGMLGFSTAFASPFFLLALFPQWLSKMPRAGGWMVAVKAFMGFLELAAALKFLSNADLVWGTGLLSRPAFLAVWFAIMAMGGLYLLGWLRLPHDAGGQIGSLRRVFGLASIALAVYCLGGINGRSLGFFEGLLPPEADRNLRWVSTYEEALRLAQEERKPVFIDFTGVTCANCRLMEKEVFSQPEVQEEFRHFVTAKLYTDRFTPEDDRHQQLQLERFGQTTLPLYVVLDPQGDLLGERDFNLDVEGFVRFLRESRERANRMARGS